MNDAWLDGDDVDVGIEVDELEEQEQDYQGKVVSGGEPAEVEDFVEGDDSLDEDESDESLFWLGAG